MSTRQTVINPRRAMLMLLSVALLIVGAGQEAVMTAPLSHPLLSFGAGNDVGATTGDVYAVVAGDLDNDGDADLASGDASGAITVWRNESTPFVGLWSSREVGNSGDSVYALVLVDLDHDGDLDLVSGCGGGATYGIVAWQNDGTPFDSAWPANGVGGAADVLSLAVGDLDHDRYPDIISGDVSAVIGAWRNDGTPFTGLWTTYQMVGNTTDATHALALGDLDNDGDLDMASGDANKRVLVWQNDGSPFSGTWDFNSAGSGKDAINTLALADLNGDGALDIVSDIEHPSATDHGIAGWQNDGSPFSGWWSEAIIGTSTDAVHALALGDLNNDGAVDVVLGSGAGEDYEVIAWYSPASPFVDPWIQEEVGASADDVNGVALADLDRDGDLDVTSGSGAGEDYELVVWENTHTPEAFGSWVEVGQPDPIYDSLAVALADFDHDGATDIADGSGGKGVLVWRGNGGTTWDRVGETDLPDSGIWRAVTWGQINNQREVDLATASSTGGLRAWHAWEAGGDWDDRSTGLPVSGDYYAVTLGDVDHDGWLDLVAGGDNVGVGVWRGDGSGWDLKKALGGGQSFCDLRLGHVDHDGNLDIVAAHCGNGGVWVWLGDGGFGFDSTIPPSATGTYWAVALGDVNRDGYADVVAALEEGGIEVWAGDGGSSWTSLTGLSDLSTVYGLDLADFDSDGYLDLLAASKGEGLRVWRGDGGVSWSDTSAGLPDTGTFYDADFGRVDGDAALDIVAAETGTSGVRVWTAFEPPPGGWDNFQPVTWLPDLWVTSQVITATIEVADAGSGLDVSTAEYRFSRDGGASWIGGWQPATCTGSDGTTDPQTITAASVPFNQDSGTQNAIQFRISDLAGLTGISDVYYVAIDSTPPTNPADLASSSHTVGEWSNDDSIHFAWTDRGSDGLSGVRGYSFDLTQEVSERPDEVLDMDGRGPGPFSTTQYATSDGDWYFHLMTRDIAGNWAEPVHLGPYQIDTAPPTVPTLTSSSHTVGGWSNDNTIWVSWDASDDGSGVAGYSYVWDDHPSLWVDTTLDITESSMTSDPLSDDQWYLHIRAIDQGGNASDIAHIGPFGVDTTDPYGCWINSPYETTNTSFLVEWSYLDATSGVASYDVQVRDGSAGVWTDWQMGTSDTSATYTGAQHLHTYTFRVRARDQAGNLTSYACQDETTVVEDLEATALEVTQVIQNLANDVPLVEGKRTYVRFYVRSGWTDVPDVDAELHGSRDGSPLPGSPLSPTGGRITAHTSGGDRANLDEAFYFALPPDWRSGTVEFRGVVNPDHAIVEEDYTNNEHLETVTFESGCDLCLMMVPVHLHPDTYHVGDAGYTDIIRLLGVYFPVAEGGIEDHEGRTMTPFGHEFGRDYNLPDDYGFVLADLWCYAFWTWDRPCADMHFFGMVHPNSQPTGSAGMGYRPGHQAAGVMAITRGGRWPQPAGGQIIAHELGHNFGRQHVLCTGCEPDGGPVDPSYPYLEPVPPICNNPYTCRIGPNDPTAYYGFWPDGPRGPEIFPPTGATDLMSYGQPRWISDWTYRALGQGTCPIFGGASFASAQDEPLDLPPAWVQAEEYLFAAGVITPTEETAELKAFYRISEPNPEFVARSLQQEQENGIYTLVLEDTLGNDVYTHIFTMTALTDGGPSPDQGAFAEVLPYDLRTARIVLEQGETELASRSVSVHAPTVTVLSPNGGEVFTDTLPISWTAYDDDGDNLFYTVQYSRDDGETWLSVGVDWTSTSLTVSVEDVSTFPGSDQARIRVIATDGVNTGEDESDAVFTLARRPPRAYIVEPTAGSQFELGSTIVLSGRAMDTEDGSLDEEALVWTSDLSGTLGTGGELWVSDLMTGTHHITLTATDSDLMKGSAEVVIHVGIEPQRIYLPVILRE